MNSILKLFFKEKQVSLKATVLSLFSFLTIILTLVLSSQLLYFSKQLSYESINIKLSGLVNDVQNSIKTNDKVNTQLINLLSINNLATKEFYTKVLENNPSLYAVYTGYEDGSFYEIINFDIHPTLRNLYKAKSSDRWLFINIEGKNPLEKEIIFLDKDLHITASKVEENSYNPTLRPWYIEASKNDSVIKTQPYTFSTIPSKGVTFAKVINESKNVVSIDVLIHDIQAIFKQHIHQDYMEAYLFDNNSEVITSYSNKEVLLNQFLQQEKEFEKFKTPALVTLDNIEYVVQVVPLNNNYNQEFLALFAQFDEVSAPYKKKIILFIFLFFITLLFLLPFMIYLSNIIVKPIYKLVEQSKKVKDREFENIEKVQSPVLEVALLSSSMQEMAQSISSYQHSLEEKVKQRTQELSIKNEELLKLSITDKLTGLYNRVKLDKSLHDEMSRSFRTKESFCVILMDIDFFKKVNDIYGHQVGDDVLVETAQILKQTVRKIDVLGRWGGEEFLIVCPETSLEGAKVLALKINAAIERYVYKTYPKTVTMSLGVASFQEGITQKAEDIVANADNALYEAKRNGRNQVQIFN